VSVFVGTWFGLQLAATLQLPPAVLIQVMVSASALKLAVSSNANATVATGRQIAAKYFIILRFDYIFGVNFRVLPDLLMFLPLAPFSANTTRLRLTVKLYINLTDALN
jgi:hypothetical protein